MPIDPRLLDILESIQSGRTPEDACAQHPELLADVRRHLARIANVRDELDALFPEAIADTPATHRAGPTSLPEIPGHVVESELGRGGMGVVYKARHLRFNRAVAIKMMLAGGYAGPPELARFFREAEALAGLGHPNIVQVHEVGDLDGLPYFTMEYVNGGDLAQQLAGVPQNAEHAAELVATLANAIEAAHRDGIVHRDLKPANVLLSDSGTPKISDFGLARRSEPGNNITRSGARVGTPSYMAPEQAAGRLNEVGAATDVYALGAILYEMLTGRPPFRAETAIETERQVIAQEPAAPSKLNAKVPRDLEIICLKCLRKDPRDRYDSAKSLEDDLNRFRRGEPITARPVGWFERTIKAARRRPSFAFAVGGSVLLVIAVLGGTLALTLERRAKDRARQELAQIDQQRLDREFVARLDAIRLNRPVITENSINWHANRDSADREYQAAFRQAGYGEVGEDPARVAARVTASRIRNELVTALDDWSICLNAPTGSDRRQWLLDVTRRVDGDPTGIRERLHDPTLRSDPESLRALASAAIGSEVSVQLLVALGEQLVFANLDPVPFMTEVQKRHPGDFWANFMLGAMIVNDDRNTAEAVRYFQAALAMRPDSAVLHAHMGGILGKLKRRREAIEYLKRSVRLDPNQVESYVLLGSFLRSERRIEETVEELERAVKFMPNVGKLHAYLGAALEESGREREALEHDKRAVEINPADPWARSVLGHTLAAVGRMDESIEQYRHAIRLRPGDTDAYINIAHALGVKGKKEEAILYLRQAIRIDPSIAVSHENLSALLYHAGWLDEAIVYAAEGVRLDPRSATARGKLGASLIAVGRDEEGVSQLQEMTRIEPKNLESLVALSGGLMELGRWSEAQDACRKALSLHAPGTEVHQALTLRIARIDRYRALSETIEKMLDGSHTPANADEWLHWAELCGVTKRYATATRCYVAAFANAPELAQQLADGPRYRAAIVAVLAGSGIGDEAKQLDSDSRAMMRSQALEWLEADLKGWNAHANRREAMFALRRWRADVRLARVRDNRTLDSLPESERKQWRSFWNRVTEFTAGDSSSHIDRAHQYASKCDWKRASEMYTKHVELFPGEDGETWFECAATRLLAGDLTGYRAACDHMRITCSKNLPMIRPYHAARALTLSPGPLSEMKEIAAMANRELQTSLTQFWSLTERGALALRAGQSQEAQSLFNQSISANSKPGAAIINWLWLSLAAIDLEDFPESERWLATARAWLDSHAKELPRNSEEIDLHYHNWLEAQILRKEAEAHLLEKKRDLNSRRK